MRWRRPTLFDIEVAFVGALVLAGAGSTFYTVGRLIGLL